jgi:hypothetical protein
MNDTPVDEALRERFQELRTATQESGGVPEFSAIMARAEAAVATQPALEVVTGGAVGSRRWMRLGAWGSVALAATVAGLLLVRSGPTPDEEFARLVASYSSEVSAGAWRSPTSGLLEVPGMDLMRSMPSIGAPLPQYDVIESPEPGAALRDDA